MMLILLVSISFSACAKKTELPDDKEPTSKIAVTPTAVSSATPAATPASAPAPTSGGSPASGVSSNLVKDYFPFEKDRHLVYKGGGFENSGFEYYTDYISGNRMQLSENNGGTNLVHVYEVNNGELKLVYNEGEIYHRYNYLNLTNREEIMIKEPIKTGTAWNLADGTVRSITGTDLSINTPSGNYTAIEVTSKKDDWVMKDYYAKGMGLDKRIYTSTKDNFTMTSELGKVEKGLPFKQSIRFFFPDVQNDKIVSVERTVEILTNEDMKWKFQKELKTPPENSGLSKVLTTNTQINSIRLDPEKDMVIADFSSHLVKEMNAGTSYQCFLRALQKPLAAIIRKVR
jgi:hypothetical protein